MKWLLSSLYAVCIKSLAVYVIFQLSQVQSLRSAVRSNLFPSAEMILCLSREFGIPITVGDFTGR